MIVDCMTVCPLWGKDPGQPIFHLPIQSIGSLFADAIAHMQMIANTPTNPKRIFFPLYDLCGDHVEGDWCHQYGVHG